MKHRVFIVLWGLVACQGEGPSDEVTSEEGSPPEEVVAYPSLPGLDAVIEEEMSAGNVPGLSACIIKGGQTVWCGGYGYANLETELAVTPTTPFMLASVSKPVTAVALMHLVESGAIGLDDPINDHLDFSVVHPTDSTPITARMLLSHTAGIVDNWAVLDTMVVDGDSPVSLGDFMEGYLSPGGQWYNADRNFLRGGVASRSEYSNIGAALAGYLVESVSGQPFDDYCDTHLFEPLSMTQTGWHLSDFDASTVAVPYEWFSGSWRGLAHYGYPDYPNGGLRTGAEQLSRFLLMFANGGELDGVRILSEAGVAEMKQAHYPELDDTQGLVWYSWRLEGTQVIGHNGGDYGSATEMGFRADGTGFVVLMNGEGGNRTLSNIEAAMMAAAEDL